MQVVAVRYVDIAVEALPQLSKVVNYLVRQSIQLLHCSILIFSNRRHSRKLALLANDGVIDLYSSQHTRHRGNVHVNAALCNGQQISTEQQGKAFTQ